MLGRNKDNIIFHLISNHSFSTVKYQYFSSIMEEEQISLVDFRLMFS